jgi:lipopolysaccharide export system permease protein
MRVTPDKRILEFNLQDGWRYQERGNPYEGTKSEYIRVGFKTYNKQFDLGSLGFTNRTADSVNKNNERMFSMRQLNKALDSLDQETSAVATRMSTDMVYLFPFSGVLEKPWKTDQLPAAEKKRIQRVKFYKELLPDTAIINVGSAAKSTASSVRMSAESLRSVLEDKNRVIRRHSIEWHRKITLSLACIILFLIGAPLGAIIRKGGLGTPLIFAIIFFMLFYFSSTIGEKFAKENSVSPWLGMWMATIVLLPVGLFLTYKAMRDSKLLNKETYTPLLRFISRFSFRRKSIITTS